MVSSAFTKAMERSERTVCVGDIPAELCEHGAADVRVATVFGQFGEVLAVCLHPHADGTGWGTVTFAQADAARAALAAGVTVDVAPGDDWKQTVAVRLKLQQATLAMEVRALAAVRIGGRGAAPVRRSGHSSFCPATAAAAVGRERAAAREWEDVRRAEQELRDAEASGDGAAIREAQERLAAEQREAEEASRANERARAERAELVRRAVQEHADATPDAPTNAVDRAAAESAVVHFVKELPDRLWTPLETLRKPPAQRSHSEISSLMQMARRQEIGFVTRLTTAEQRRLCRVLRVVLLPTGKQVYAEGDRADNLYIVWHGAATATTQYGGGGTKRRAQLLLDNAESEEESDWSADEDDGEPNGEDDGGDGQKGGEDGGGGEHLGRHRFKTAVSAVSATVATRSVAGHLRNTQTDEVCAHCGKTGHTKAFCPRLKAEAVRRGSERRLGELGVGQHFGELALVRPGSVRTATVVARCPTALLVLSYEDFCDTLKLGHEDEELAELETQLSRLTSCPIFHGLPLRNLLTLSDLAECRTFPKGFKIYSQGDVANEISLVLSGRVAFSKRMPRRVVSPPRGPRNSAPSTPRSGALAERRQVTPMQSAASEHERVVEYWIVHAGELGKGAVLSAQGAHEKQKEGNLLRHSWTTTASTDVEVLTLSVHTLLRRTAPETLERVQEYLSCEIRKAELEQAVRREQDWQQKRSLLFVHITGKGQTQKQKEMAEVWVERAARSKRADADATTPRAVLSVAGGSAAGGGAGAAATKSPGGISVVRARIQSRFIGCGGA